MPYPNEHAVRIANPDQYASIRRQNDKFGDGIDALFGITKEGKAELQAIRFDAAKFTADEARKWLKEHDYNASLEEAAQANSEVGIIANDISVTDGRPVPTRILILPWGQVKAANGDFLVDAESAALIVNAFASAKNEIPIDYEHQTLGGKYSSPNGMAPAAGWIRSLDVQPGAGIFATVSWTAEAQAMLANREYRYLSPVIALTGKGRRATELHSCALTNKPAIYDAPPLVNKAGAPSAANDERTLEMDAITTALGLAQGSDEASCVKAIEAFKAKIESAKTEADQAGALRVLVCKAAGLDEKSAHDKVVAAVSTLRKAEPDKKVEPPSGLLVNSVADSRRETIDNLVRDGFLTPAAAKLFAEKHVGAGEGGKEAVIEAFSRGSDGSEFKADVAILKANGPVIAFKQQSGLQLRALSDPNKANDDAEAEKARKAREERMSKETAPGIRG